MRALNSWASAKREPSAQSCSFHLPVCSRWVQIDGTACGMFFFPSPAAAASRPHVSHIDVLKISVLEPRCISKWLHHCCCGLKEKTPPQNSPPLQCVKYILNNWLHAWSIQCTVNVCELWEWYKKKKKKKMLPGSIIIIIFFNVFMELFKNPSLPQWSPGWTQVEQKLLQMWKFEVCLTLLTRQWILENSRIWWLNHPSIKCKQMSKKIKNKHECCINIKNKNTKKTSHQQQIWLRKKQLSRFTHYHVSSSQNQVPLWSCNLLTFSEWRQSSHSKKEKTGEGSRSRMVKNSFCRETQQEKNPQKTPNLGCKMCQTLHVSRF